MIPPLYIVAVAVPFVTTAAIVEDGFTGDYTAKTEDGTLALTLAQEGDAVTGTFSDGSTKMGLRGTMAAGGKQVTGKLSLDGQALPITFTLKRDGNQIRFAMTVAGEEDSFLFSPSGAAKPKSVATGKSPASTKEAPPTKPITPVKGAATYRHPAGFHMPLVGGWRVTSSVGGLGLLPPGTDKATAEEGYLLILTDAGGEKVARKIEETFAQSPELKRSRESTADGWAYEGKVNGTTARIRCFVASGNNGLGAILIANGTAAKMKAREPALESMIRGAKWEGSAADGRLVGTWRGGLVTADRDVRGTGGKLTVTGATDTNTSYQIGADGVFAEVTTSRSIFIGQGVSIDTGDSVEKKESRWAGENGVLSISKNGLILTGAYRFEGERLIVTFGDKTLALRRN